MTLLGSFIDVRTNISLAAEATTTFAHGLPASPDFVIVTGSATIASTVSAALSLVPTWDATNVTVKNIGEGTCPSIRIVSVVAHSIIR